VGRTLSRHVFVAIRRQGFPNPVVPLEPVSRRRTLNSSHTQNMTCSDRVHPLELERIRISSGFLLNVEWLPNSTQ